MRGRYNVHPGSRNAALSGPLIRYAIPFDFRNGAYFLSSAMM